MFLFLNSSDFHLWLRRYRFAHTAKKKIIPLISEKELVTYFSFQILQLKGTSGPYLVHVFPKSLLYVPRSFTSVFNSFTICSSRVHLMESSENIHSILQFDNILPQEKGGMGMGWRRTPKLITQLLCKSSMLEEEKE